VSSNGNDAARSIEAVRALRDRGIDNAEELLEYGTPEEILRVCRRWDSRKGVGPGLLARWIRSREFDEPEPASGKADQLRARMAEYARRFPVGSVAETHRVLSARRWPDDDPCSGEMVVVEADASVLALECDACGFGVAYTPRCVHVLGQ
jgi:hypothetical protein